MRIFLLISSLAITVNLVAQTPPNYHPPIGIPLVLASNFGELRPNHFHMGVDFKTNGKEGYNLYSIEKGYVARAKISTSGYGNVVYVNHPNGITSVYAHCSEFKGALDSLVKHHQLRLQQNEVDLYFSESDIPLERGEVFALSGNSGSSTAPHLHFELRETATDRALNPLVHGFELADTRAPVLTQAKFYGLDENGYMLPGKHLEYTVKPRPGVPFFYSFPNDTVRIPSDFNTESGAIGFAFGGYDLLDGAANHCGLFESRLSMSEEVVFHAKIDSIFFEHTRDINAYKDYSDYQSKRSKLHKTFYSGNNDLTVYNKYTSGIQVYPGDYTTMQYVAFDANRNNSTLEFVLVRDSGAFTPFVFNKSTYFFPEQDTVIIEGENQIRIEPCTFYEPILKSQLTATKIGSYLVALKIPVEIRMKPLAGIALDRQYIAVEKKGGNWSALPTQLVDGHLIALSKLAGRYRVMSDLVPPSILGKSYNSSYIVKGNTVVMAASDQGTGIRDYQLWVEGSWTILNYEPKTGRMWYAVDPTWLGQSKAVKIVLHDEVGNETVYERTLKF